MGILLGRVVLSLVTPKGDNMFPDDSGQHEDHNDNGIDESCLNCGFYHGDLMDKANTWIREVTGGYVSTWQLMTAIRSLVLTLRQMQPVDIVTLLLAREAHIVEDYLRDHDYMIPSPEGDGKVPFMTVETRQQNIAEMERLLEEGIPDFIPDDLGGSNEQ
jgi:hypothetical protein